MTSDWNQIAFAESYNVEVVTPGGVGNWTPRLFRGLDGFVEEEERGVEDLFAVLTAEERRLRGQDVRGRVVAMEEKVWERKGRKRLRTVTELQEDMNEMIELGERLRDLVDETVQKRARILKYLQSRRRRASLDAQSKRMAKVETAEFSNEVGSPF